MKTLTKEEMAEKYKGLHGMLVSRELCPQMKILCNEVSKVLLEFMVNDNVDFQLVSAYIHWHNAAERAISTWGNNFLARLSNMDDGFLMHLLDRLIDQSDRTLNIL